MAYLKDIEVMLKGIENFIAVRVPKMTEVPSDSKMVFGIKKMFFEFCLVSQKILYSITIKFF